MRKGVRIVFGIAGTAALVFILVVVFGMRRNARGSVSCTGLKVEFADSGKFVTAKDIEQRLARDYGAFIGVGLDSLDLGRMEAVIDSMGAVSKAEVYTTPDGTLNIKLRQMQAVVRFRDGATGFYADKEGRLFPLQKNHTAAVLLVEGEIPLTYREGSKGRPTRASEAEWLENLLAFIEFQNSSKVWRGFFRRYLVNGDGDLVLIPANGGERFVFGDPGDHEAKFRKIEDYYTAILPEKGAGFYSSVNVKYNGQIVCRK